MAFNYKEVNVFMHLFRLLGHICTLKIMSVKKLIMMVKEPCKYISSPFITNKKSNK